MREIWRDIRDYEGQYQISNFGRCKSLARKNWNGYGYWYSNETYLKERPVRGYLNYQLRKHSKLKSIGIHQLVARAFIPNPLNLTEVNHIDGNKHNNHISNLEWCTHAENMKHAGKNNLMRKGINHPNTKATPEIIEEIYTKYMSGLYTQKQLENEYKISRGRISVIIKERNKQKQYESFTGKNKKNTEFFRQAREKYSE